jgi:hypothetical protein
MSQFETLATIPRKGDDGGPEENKPQFSRGLRRVVNFLNFLSFPSSQII